MGQLDGLRVLVPRSARQARPLAQRLAARGADPVVAPVLEMAPTDADELRAAFGHLGAVEVVAFTSSNAVRALAAVPEAARAVLRARRVVAVGRATAAAVADLLGVEAEVPATRATGDALARALGPGTGTIVLPRGDLASDVAPRLLREAGWDVREIVAYRTVGSGSLPPEVVAGVQDGTIDVVTVASPSTVEGLVRLVGPPPWGSAVVAIGPVTAAACARVGLPVAAEASTQDVDGLVDAVARAVGRGRRH